MPQINQLHDVFASQLFWLVIVFGLVYFGIARNMVPKIMSTMDARDGRISADLAAAEGARQAADATEEAYRARMNDSRAEALKVTAGAKADSARASEARIAAADAGIRDRIEAAEARLRERATAAAGEIETVAAEAARAMVGRLAGIEVSAADAAQAVKAAANG
jgi:F-type H+-transporting ATPase subunit b